MALTHAVVRASQTLGDRNFVSHPVKLQFYNDLLLK